MKKKIISLFVVLTFCISVVFCACGGAGNKSGKDDIPLTSEEILEIKKAYCDIMYNGRKTAVADEIIEIFSYYGNYDGAIVVTVDGKTGISSYRSNRFTAMGYEFVGTPKSLFKVYKDGEMKSLDEACENGWLKEEDIKAVHEIYAEEYAVYYKDASATEDYEKIRVQFNEQIGAASSDCDVFYTSLGSYASTEVLSLESEDFWRNSHSATCKAGEATFNLSGMTELRAYRDGVLHTVESAYENGWLTAQDIEKALALHKAMYPYVYISREEAPSADEKTKEKMAREYYEKSLKLNYENVKASQVQADAFYGEYSGASVYHFTTPLASVTVCVTCILGGVVFGFGSPMQVLEVYKDGSFLSLEAAYRTGWLSVSDLRALQSLYYLR